MWYTVLFTSSALSSSFSLRWLPISDWDGTKYWNVLIFFKLYFFNFLGESGVHTSLFKLSVKNGWTLSNKTCNYRDKKLVNLLANLSIIRLFWQKDKVKRLTESPLLIEYLIQSGAFIFPALVDTLRVMLSQRSLYRCYPTLFAL